MYWSHQTDLQGSAWFQKEFARVRVRFKSHIENYLVLQFEWLLHILLIRDVSLAEHSFAESIN